MQYADIEDKPNKTKVRMISAASLLEEMQGLESYYGTTKEKIVDNWYELKRRLNDALTPDTKEKKQPEDENA